MQRSVAVESDASAARVLHLTDFSCGGSRINCLSVLRHAVSHSQVNIVASHMSGDIGHLSS